MYVTTATLTVLNFEGRLKNFKTDPIKAAFTNCQDVIISRFKLKNQYNLN